MAKALADIATIGILQQRTLSRSSVLAENLQRALNTRIVVEQAKGVLSERGSMPMDETFDLLRNYARSHNMKLSELARSVVYPPNLADRCSPPASADLRPRSGQECADRRSVSHAGPARNAPSSAAAQTPLLDTHRARCGARCTTSHDTASAVGFHPTGGVSPCGRRGIAASGCSHDPGDSGRVANHS